MNEKLDQVFKDVFHLDDFNENISIGTIKEWDSFGHVTLMIHLEKEFGIKISLTLAQELRSYKEISEFINKQK